MSVYRRGSIWWVRFQWRGKDIRRPAKTRNRATAQCFERWLKEEFGRIDRGGKPRRTFDEMMARFISEHLPTLRPSSQRRYLTNTAVMASHFGGKHLDEIDRGRLSNFIAERRREVSSTTIRRDLACLSSAFQLAVAWDWCDANPVRTVNKRQIKEGAPRRRYLSEAEYQRMLPTLPSYIQPMAAFAVETGLRAEEQFSLEWNQVSLRRREVFLPRTKSGTPRTVPLSDAAVEILQRLPRHLRSSYVFCRADGSRYYTVNRSFIYFAKRAGIDDLRWHDLRRTFGSWKLQRGVKMSRLSRLLGHKSIVTTERAYAFLRVADLHEAIRISTKAGTVDGDTESA